MRRKIQLYIGESRADIDDQALVLFNYAFTDAEKPTAVKNSYSKPVTLPATPANDAIFGFYARADRETSGTGSTGPSFNAGRKTPFTIMSDEGAVLEAGYVRLDEVTRKGAIVTGYKVTLFGGIGALLYALSYTDEGEKMTLADLTYFDLQNPSTELDFVINAGNVTAAWERLRLANPSTVSSKWDVINFAPAYEGFPDGDFDADKGYGRFYELGLTVPTGYSADSSSGVLVKFPEKVDQWAAKDLRSYLQHPVVSVKAMLAGMRRKASDAGMKLDLSALASADYNTLWKMLPSIPSLGSFRNISGLLVATLSSTATTAQKVADWALSGTSSFNGLRVSASLAYKLRWNTPDYLETRYFNKGTEKVSLTFVQILAYAGSVLVGGSDVLVVGPDTVNLDPYDAANRCGYTPLRQPQGWHYYGTQPDRPASGQYAVPGDIVMEVEATSVTRYELRVVSYVAGGYFSGDTYSYAYFEGGQTSVPTLWDGSGVALQLTSAIATDAAEESNYISYSSPSGPRSGAALGKRTLLHSAHTPAEYLVSLAKQLGWVFICDPAAKTVKVMKRDTFFCTGEDPVDLTGRIDLSKGLTIVPLAHSAKWYTFSLDMAQGAFAKEYKGIYGVDFGIQRVNTGYDFNSDEVGLLDGNAFKAAVSKLDHGKYWNIFKDGTNFRPSMFAFPGCTYTLTKNSDGSLVDFDVPALPSTATIGYYNADFPGYDIAGVTRAELCDADGKPVSGEDVLLRYNGQNYMPRFTVTDDSAAMMELNGGRPCWWLSYGNDTGIRVPQFSRLVQSSGTVTGSLDFGIPREVDVPGIDFADGCTLYQRRWAAYLRDLLDKDTKVMKCRVLLDGLTVGPELLRRFYYYENAVWVLSKITNYSLTTYDPAECEFIQVRDMTNYTSGQS